MVEIDPELIQVIGQNPLLSPFEIFNQDILKTNLQELGLNNQRLLEIFHIISLLQLYFGLLVLALLE